MVKRHYLSNYLSELPDFVFTYIEEYYNGESINTQLGYSLDVKVFLNYLRKFRFRDVEKNEDFTLMHIEKVTPADLIRFKAYLREYETEYTSPAGKPIKRICRNSAYGINRKLSAVRGMFIYLYKTEQISQNVTDKVDFAKLHQKIKKPLTSQETMQLIDVIYNGEKYFEGRNLTEYKNKKERDIAIFTTYLGTGVRVSELVNLQVTDVDFDTQSFIVTRKGGDQQEIFMPVQVNNAIYDYLYKDPENVRDSGPLFLGRGGKPLSTAAVEKTLKNYC
ncbi:MAG: tyrosine-type recombinase/integrase, partial [Clostridia bacterium]|nr:tyrosine-type recombinase/integrase [Clostridia bacterium]